MSDERDLAIALVAELSAADPGLVRAGAVDLASALEQHLYLRLTAVPGSNSGRGRFEGLAPWAAGILSAAEASTRWVASGRGRWSAGSSASSAAVLMLAAVHCRIWAPVADALATRGQAPPPIIRATRFVGPEAGCGQSLALNRFLSGGSAADLWMRAADRPLRVRAATRGWEALAGRERGRKLRGSAARALQRLALQAERLDALRTRLRPTLLVTFAELSEWARLVAAFGRAAGVRTLGLPHAEAANPDALAGLDYDQLAVFGPRSASVVKSAGYPESRVAVTGAPHFDALLQRDPAPEVRPRRVVFASQYTGGRMTPAVKAETVRVAIRVADAVAPAELVIKRHPVESDKIVEEVIREGTSPDLAVRIVDHGSIADVLDGSWLLVTGWSNSVFEAGLLGVPSITINMTDDAEPTTFAAEGLSVGCSDPDTAAAAARGLLDASRRAAVVAAARQLLPEHLGPLDGRASERVADLVVALSSGGDRA